MDIRKTKMSSLINPSIITKLKEVEIGSGLDNAILYLLSIYYGLHCSFITDDIIKKVNFSKIVERDYEFDSFTWNIPLFISDVKRIVEENTGWEWVEDYRNLFGGLKPQAKGDKASALSKMKVFFAENPTVRAQDVIEAAEIYLKSFRNGNSLDYIQRADYFISKSETISRKAVSTSRLKQYLEILYEQRTKDNTDNSSRFTKQMM